jgi:hypothetical protein
VSNEIIKYAFTSGEISETLFGRSDLEQYDLGLAVAKNWVVDYRGGISTRPGFEFCDFVLRDDQPTKYFEFRFATDITNVYAVLFGHNYVRFLQDGAYVLEDPKTVTGIAGNTVTAAAHGYSNGQWVKLAGVVGPDNVNGRSFQIENVTTNTFDLLQLPDLDPLILSSAYVSDGTVSRVYTLTTTYTGADLEKLGIKQRRDLLRLTHPNFPTKNLIRAGVTNWSLVNEVIGNGSAAPVGVGASASSAGSAGVVFAVTAVFADGTESGMSLPYILQSIVNYTVTSGSVVVNWTQVANAVAYNVYRSRVSSDGTKVNAGMELGYIGQVTGAQFVDMNIIPDFTKTPPRGDNPFAPGRIEAINMTAAGSSYPAGSSTVSVSGGGGTGFRGAPVLNFNGQIVGVLILDRGQGYVNPVVSFGGAGGSGATATAIAAETSGVYPSISETFQQRQVYAATLLEPLTLWGSRPKKPSNFDYSAITIDNDAYEFEVDSSEVSPLKHLIAMRGGLIVMSDTGVWLLQGTNGGAVTPSDALAEPQNYTGVSAVPPLKVGTDLLYIEGKGFTVRLLSYNDFSRVYGGEDKSLLSNHLFADGKRITAWSFAENPFKVVHAVRSDGALLNFTIVKEEKVFAWTWSTTKGKFLDCRAVLENGLDRLYVVTRRYVNGRWTKFIERSAIREIEFSEDAFAVDCGLSLPANWPAANLTISAPTGDDVTFTASAGVFSSGDVNKVIRAGGGKAYVTQFLSSFSVKGRIVREITDVVAEDPDNTVYEQLSGTWTLDTPQTVINGLWHLEGQELAVLADGNVVENCVVEDGKITLPAEATRVIAGLKYTPILKTLPPVVSDAIIEARRKRVLGVAVRVSDTRGLSSGRSLDSLYDMKERTNETYGEPIELFDGIRVQLIEPNWDENGQTYFVQNNPLPATLLGIVFDMEVGDDPD